jgi:nucleotide-binding universal stress UspA family protein
MLKDFLCGSITNKLIERLTHVPICVVGGTPKIGKILMALDASEGAMRAVDYIAAMMDGPDWKFTLFHAIRDLDGKELRKAEKTIFSVFEVASDHLERAGFNRNQITTRTVANVPSRAGALIVEALNGEYGTIVVGRRGLSGVEEFAMGRVSNKVIQMARTLAVWVVT